MTLAQGDQILGRGTICWVKLHTDVKFEIQCFSSIFLSSGLTQATFHYWENIYIRKFNLLLVTVTYAKAQQSFELRLEEFYLDR